ncbi:hypothetical protein EII18_03020 [Comamonadaceae bacterium OH3737_COT-264]|nr:hypothetical protein EII18_03020 [Comamonadaceae bacterium OH3737_COT-264]
MRSSLRWQRSTPAPLLVFELIWVFDRNRIVGDNQQAREPAAFFLQRNPRLPDLDHFAGTDVDIDFSHNHALSMRTRHATSHALYSPAHKRATPIKTQRVEKIGFFEHVGLNVFKK